MSAELVHGFRFARNGLSALPLATFDGPFGAKPYRTFSTNLVTTPDGFRSCAVRWHFGPSHETIPICV